MALLAMLVGLTGCALGPKQGLAPFASDGCSLFPDSYPIAEVSWLHCCVAHDQTYWRGGTQQERKQADQQLRTCVSEATGDPALAQTMYNGVRIGGSAQFPTTYRWAYGWPYRRGYQMLTPQEQREAEAKLNQWRAEQHRP